MTERAFNDLFSRTVQRNVIDQIIDDIRVFPSRLECDVNFLRLYPVRLSPLLNLKTTHMIDISEYRKSC